MKNILKLKHVGCLLGVVAFFVPGLILAEDEANTFDSFNLFNSGGWAAGDPLTITGSIIGIVLSFVGLIFLILIIYAGFMLIFADGEEGKVTSARKIITSAVIGLIVTLAAYGIAYVVFSNINSDANQNNDNPECSGTCKADCSSDEKDLGMGPCTKVPGQHCCTKATQTGGACQSSNGSCIADKGFFGTKVCNEDSGKTNLGQMDCGANYHCCK